MPLILALALHLMISTTRKCSQYSIIGVGEDRPASGRSVAASARKFAPTGFVSSDPPVHDLSHAMRANASMRATALYAG